MSIDNKEDQIESITKHVMNLMNNATSVESIYFGEDESQIIKRLRNKGCALVIFVPEELKGVNVDEVELSMIEKGWESIRKMKNSVNVASMMKIK